MSPGSAVRRLGRSLIDAEEWLFDLRHSIETREQVRNPYVDAEHAESAARGTRYEAARLYVLRRLIVECLKSGEAPRTFVDVGCGKGRVCFFAAATRQYDRIVGIELSASLVETARRNLARFHTTRSIEFLCEDARHYRMPSEQSLVFLNNPFDATILREFLDNNCEQFARTRTLIAYHHDFHRKILGGYSEILFRDQKLGLSLYRATT